MSSLKFGARRKLSRRRAGVASIAGAALLALSGCASFVPVGGGNTSMAIWDGVSQQVAEGWPSETCFVDFDKDGSRGDPQDRAHCAMYFIRVGVCNNFQAGSREHNACYAATNSSARDLFGQPMWESFNVAVGDIFSGRDDCFRMVFRDSDLGIWGWGAVDLGQAGCRR